MKQVTRLKTETQLIKRTDNERAYTQALHSILFRSGKLQGVSSRDSRSNDMIRFHIKDNEHIPYQYTDTIVLIDGTTREEFYTALVMKDVIHIKISYVYTHTEDVFDKRSADEAYDENGNYLPTTDEVPVDELEDELTGEPVKVLGKIDLDKCS